MAVHASREGSIASSGSLLALLAHGVPTVALATRFDDPIFDGALRYADDDEAGLTRALQRLLDEPAAGAALSHAAFERARACFGWPLVAERVEQALEGEPRDARLVAA
jgi:glycosyltransferase involved in cell wall biosynthesis